MSLITGGLGSSSSSGIRTFTKKIIQKRFSKQIISKKFSKKIIKKSFKRIEVQE